LRAALRLHAHYLDLSSHLTRNPFQANSFRYAKRFEEKNRSAVIDAGGAPGLTNLLVKRAADMLDEVSTVQIRLYESSESDDPISNGRRKSPSTKQSPPAHLSCRKIQTCQTFFGN